MQLLARERPHVGVEGAQGGELPPGVLRDLVDHRALAVHHLVVRDRQHEVLRVGVDHREGHLVVVVLPVDRLQREVAQGVVHPAHVPLEAEPETAVVHRLGDAAEGRRLLGDHDDAGDALVEVLVHVAQEVDGLEVLVAAVDVRHPLPVLAGVVEVEHGRDRVHPQRVDVELGDPVQGVGDQERLHLVAAVVEDVGAPVLVLALTRVGVLVEGRAVEAAQRPLVLGEVAGHPVEDDADAGLVQAVDQVAELVGTAEARHRREVVGHLVAPGRLEGVLGDRHQLDVGVALPGHVLDQLVGEFEVGLAAAPGTEVHLVGAHRLGVRAATSRAWPSTRRRPTGTCWCRRWRSSPAPARRRTAIGSTFSRQTPSCAQDVELVQRTGADALDEERPHTGARERACITSPVHQLKSAFSRTSRALGAQTANRVPWSSPRSSSKTVTSCAPSRFQHSVSPPLWKPSRLQPVNSPATSCAITAPCRLAPEG